MKLSDKVVDRIATIVRISVLSGAVAALAFAAGCFAPCVVNVNIGSSRMVQAQGTNRVDMAIEGGGGNMSSNSTSATMPVK